MVHQRKAICESQLEAIIENPGNTGWKGGGGGGGQAFGPWFADRLYSTGV